MCVLASLLSYSFCVCQEEVEGYSPSFLTPSPLPPSLYLSFSLSFLHTRDGPLELPSLSLLLLSLSLSLSLSLTHTQWTRDKEIYIVGGVGNKSYNSRQGSLSDLFCCTDESPFQNAHAREQPFRFLCTSLVHTHVHARIMHARTHFGWF